MTYLTNDRKHEQTMRNLFDRISCLQATSEFNCGKGIEWKDRHPTIQIHGLVTSVGMQILNEEVDGNLWYDDENSLGLRVY